MNCANTNNCANLLKKCDDCVFNEESGSFKSWFEEKDYETSHCGEEGCSCIDYGI